MGRLHDEQQRSLTPPRPSAAPITHHIDISLYSIFEFAPVRQHYKGCRHHQVKRHAASWLTGAACLAIFGIAIFMTRGTDRGLTRLDWILLSIALISFAMLFVIDDKTVSLCLTLFATLVGFSLTLRKAWYKPREEDPTAFGLNAIKFLPAIFALSTFSFLTVAYPLTAGLANAAVGAVILLRR